MTRPRPSVVPRSPAGRRLVAARLPARRLGLRLAALGLVGTLALVAAPARAHEPAAVRDFADALLDEGDHYRAIGAYKAYLFLAPDAPDRDLVGYRVALAYFRGEQLDAASSYAADLAADPAARPEVRRAGWLLGGRSLFGAERYGLASEHLRRFLLGPGGEAATGELAYAHYLLGWTHLRAHDLEDAGRAFSRVPAGTALSAPAQALAGALEGDVRLPWRSPFLAGVLSALLPGLGHMYLGLFGTGISALTWNGVFVWGAVETFRAEQWGLFALLAVLESLWYGGTIYGAISGAHRFNRDARRNLVDELEQRYPVPDAPPLPEPDRGAPEASGGSLPVPGVSLSFETRF